MASFAAACRLSARLTARQLRQDGVVRGTEHPFPPSPSGKLIDYLFAGFRTSTASLAAQNFTMPALSPTMTEGNIATWKLKEGDSFAAGDVLLEIETDKASMDVEAQDDGIVAKIIHGDGSKGIQVGVRIGVLAEAGDDLSTLEIPAEDTSAKSAPKEEATKPPPTESTSKPAPQKSGSDEAPKQSKGPAKKQTRPFLPSVGHIITEHKLDASAVEKMTPSGPNNRLLKGDVLAYIGSIASSSPAHINDLIVPLTKLNLSYKLAAPKPAATAAPISKPTEKAVEDVKIVAKISLKAVSEVRQRLESTLGISMPLSTFISRAIDVANDGLPRPKTYQPSADELFNQVLGLDKVYVGGTRGNFLPQITALPSASLSQRPTKNVDIYDLLAGKRTPIPSRASNSTLESPASENIFSLRVPTDDKQRAELFFKKMKTILELEPGLLVL